MNYKTAWAVCQGTAHIQESTPCQDAVIGWQSKNSAVIVLADGAGSSPHSSEGAETVVKAVCELMKKWCISNEPVDPAALKKQIIHCCLESLSRNAHPPEEQACTLLLCAARLDGHYFCAHIGDGYIFLSENEKIQLLSDAENGETSQETVFITCPDASEHLRLVYGTVVPGQTILLCSDGTGVSLYNKRTHKFADAIHLMSEWLHSYPQEQVSCALAKNLDSTMRLHSHDDMSIAMLACISQEK